MDKHQTFMNNKGTLYLIATPIGNLSDISKRMIETINDVSYLACEDTRNTGKLLEYLNIKKKLVSYHKFNEREMVDTILDSLSKGDDVGVVSDAGYPGISDPGFIICNEAIKEGFNVTCIGGPSAFIHALVCSGLDTSHFYFYGFLDSKENARKNELEKLKNIKDTMIFYETSNRMNECLKNMKQVFGNRKFCIGRELTKKFEEYIRGSTKEVLSEMDGIKGEIVVIVEGNLTVEKEISEQELKSEIKSLARQGKSNKEIVALLCDKYNLKKNYVYDIVVND